MLVALTQSLTAATPRPSAATTVSCSTDLCKIQATITCKQQPASLKGKRTVVAQDAHRLRQRPLGVGVGRVAAHNPQP